MKIKDINIPSEHRYLSELMDFLPGNCILNDSLRSTSPNSKLVKCRKTEKDTGFIHSIKTKKGHGEQFSMSFFYV